MQSLIRVSYTLCKLESSLGSLTRPREEEVDEGIVVDELREVDVKLIGW